MIKRKSLEEYVDELMSDPRRDLGQEHRLKTVIILAIVAVIAGANDWVAVERFCKIKADWLATIVPMPNGVPSHDTFRRVFILLPPDAFQACFMAWINGLVQLKWGEVVSLDGKTARGSQDRWNGREAIKTVSAWASMAGLVIAQRDVPEDTNEIATVPEVLRSLTLTGCVVTVDAANCQTQNARIVIEQGGDYVFALKDNQPTLYEEVQHTWAEVADGAEAMKARADSLPTPTVKHEVKHEVFTTRETAHGRTETRRYTLITDFDHIDYLNRHERWFKLAGIGIVERTRKLRDKVEYEVSFFVTSLQSGVERFADAVRRHWGIENSLHWVLDIAFHEDHHRGRVGFEPENFSVLRHFALNLIKLETSIKDSISGKRQRAGWDNDYMLKILTAGASLKSSGA